MLNPSRNSIGVLDSGIGGLTVAKELQRLLPNEDIIYFGDSANCPYGNKPVNQITELSKNMLSFLADQNIKVVAIACNTISTLVDCLIACFEFKIVGIISPAADFIAKSKLSKVGLIATEFTVSTHCYDKLIHAHDPSIEIISKGSPLLAALVDRGDFNQDDINAEITKQINYILAKSEVDTVILGCTHYPIVENNFKNCYPNITFINPAKEQANAVKQYLTDQDLLNNEPNGSFSVYTSGDPAVYINVVKRLGMTEPTVAKTVTL